MKIFGYVSLRGSNFSPLRAKERTSVSFNREHEVGEIGKKGKYKLKPYDFGAAKIDFEGDESEFLVPEKILDLIKTHKASFQESGAEDIDIFLIVGYHNQCNLELSPAFLKRIADLDITFCVSCYETDEED